MIRSILIVGLVLAWGVASVSAADTYSKPGTVSAQAGVGLAWGHFGGVNFQGGLDVGLTQIVLGPQAPIDAGVSVRGGYSTWEGFILGGYGTLHYSWKALGSGMDWLNRLETYAALGIDALPGLAMDAYVGTDYHFTKAMALFFEGGIHGGLVGVSWRF